MCKLCCFRLSPSIISSSTTTKKDMRRWPYLYICVYACYLPIQAPTLNIEQYRDSVHDNSHSNCVPYFQGNSQDRPLKEFRPIWKTITFRASGPDHVHSGSLIFDTRLPADSVWLRATNFRTKRIEGTTQHYAVCSCLARQLDMYMYVVQTFRLHQVATYLADNVGHMCNAKLRIIMYFITHKMQLKNILMPIQRTKTNSIIV